MRSLGFLAPVVAALVTSVQVASVAVSKERTARLPGLGYPIAFDDLPTNVEVGPSPRDSALSAQHAPRPGPARLVRYEVREHAGIGDRLTVIARLLSLASAFKATLAFPRPVDALHVKHGITKALWWHDFVVTQPAFVPIDEEDCASEANSFNITSQADFESLLASADDPLHDEGQPLCLRLQEHYFTLMQSQAFKDSVMEGAPNVAVWTSHKVACLAREMRDELMQKAGHYNAMHIRLGDKATLICESTSHVADAVAGLNQDYRDFAQEPWFLMSDGNETFYAGMRAEMSERGVTLITEKDLATAAAVEDNYLRYSALECVFAASDLALISYKDIGHRCLPREDHPVKPRFIGCREDAGVPQWTAIDVDDSGY